MLQWLEAQVGGYVVLGFAAGALWCVYRVGYLMKRGVAYHRFLDQALRDAQKANPGATPTEMFRKEQQRAWLQIVLALGIWAVILTALAIFATGETLLGGVVIVVLGGGMGYWQSTIHIMDGKKEVATY